MLIGRASSQSVLAEFEFLNVWSNSLVQFDDDKRPFIINLFRRLHNEYINNLKPNFNIIHVYLYLEFLRANQVNLLPLLSK